MGLRSLTLKLEMDGQEISRPFGLREDDSPSNTEELAELLSVSIARGFQDKPELIKGMLVALFDKVELARK